MSLLSPQLEAFLAIANTKTVHGAAKMLGITQTGVTQRIRALEENLKATLFTRSRRGMQLTSEGDALYLYCLSAKELEGPTLAKIQGANAGRASATTKVCITGPTSIMRTRIVPQCMPLMKKSKNLLLQLNITDHETWVQELKTHTAQLAIVPPEMVSKELDSKLLKPEKYVLVGPKAWAKRSILDIVKTERIIDFDPKDQMSFNYLKKFKLLDHALTDRLFVNNNECLADLIEAEIGYGVLTLEFAENFLKRSKISVLNEEKVLEQKFALAWYPRPESSQYWKELVGAIH